MATEGTDGVRIHIDDSELDRLDIDLRGAGPRAQFGADKAVRQGARLIHRDMKRIVDGHMGNWFGIPGTEYPTPIGQHVAIEMLGLAWVEVGVNKEGAGKLAHILAFGSVNNAPVFDHTRALRQNIPAVLRMLGDEGEDAVFGGRE